MKQALVKFLSPDPSASGAAGPVRGSAQVPVIDLSAVRRRRQAMLAERAGFADRFGRWLDAAFPGDDAAASVALGVPVSTVRMWRGAVSAPSGWVVAAAIRDFPSAAMLMEAA